MAQDYRGSGIAPGSVVRVGPGEHPYGFEIPNGPEESLNDGPIQGRVVTLIANTTELLAQIDLLEQRLAPVLGPNYPQPLAVEEDAPQKGSPLTERLDIQAKSVEYARHRIAGLIGRLEV